MKRISIQVEDGLYDRFQNQMEHGFRRHLMEKLIDLAVTAIEEEGKIMIGALIAGEYKLVRVTEEKAAS